MAGEFLMTESTGFSLKLIKQLQQYRQRIEPIFNTLERTKPLLDMLERALQEDSKIGKVRLAVDAIDDFLRRQPDNKQIPS